MYTVQWCSHEGNLQERRFERLEDAKLEAADLDEQYVGVQIVDENGNVVVAYPA